MDPIRKKQEELAKIRELKARLWARLVRTTNALDKLEKRERRLIKPRKLGPGESGEDITAKDYSKIHDPEFFDDSGVLAVL